MLALDGSGTYTEYPRAYGENDSRRRHCNVIKGIPPRIRGQLPVLITQIESSRNTPACTGTTKSELKGHWLKSEYPRLHGDNLHISEIGAWVPGIPRVHGDNDMEKFHTRLDEGIPPRTRGQQTLVLVAHHAHGNTPACMGTTPSWDWTSRWRREYPRRYGASPSMSKSPLPSSGIPPQVRGDLQRGALGACGQRYTPAGTGRAVELGLEVRPIPVYPRRYGASVLSASWLSSMAGIPPQVRGEPLLSNR